MFASLICLVTSIPFTIATNWTYPAGTLPKADNSQVAGAYNGEIFIIGGGAYGYQLTIYDIESPTYDFTFKGSSYFTMDISVTAQAYTQQGAILYVVEPSTSALSIYNFSKTPLAQESGWISLTDIDGQTCLASTEDFLFFTGGDYTQEKTDFKVLDLATLQWISNLPSRKEGRLGHGCVTANNKLYLAGGWRHKSSGLIMYISTTEYIDIRNIQNTQQQWHYGPELYITATGTRAATNGDYVFVIGGNVMSSSPSNMVHIWDTSSNTMDYLRDWMPVGVAFHVVLTVDGMLHVFGGLCCSSGGSYSNAHQIYPVGTAAPTTAPTEDTLAPSSDPTIEPTKSTIAPSNDPTFDPTIDPTTDPTVDPTQIPTKYPSNHPTSDPTNTPTYVPTFVPSSNPTLIPTLGPSYDPTSDPTAPGTTDSVRDSENDDTASAVEPTVNTFMLVLIIISAVSLVLIIIFCVDAQKDGIKRIIGKCCRQKETDTDVLADVVNETVEDEDGGIIPGVTEEVDVTEEEEEEEGGGRAVVEGQVVDNGNVDDTMQHPAGDDTTQGPTAGDDAQAAYALADV